MLCRRPPTRAHPQGTAPGSHVGQPCALLCRPGAGPVGTAPRCHLLECVDLEVPSCVAAVGVYVDSVGASATRDVVGVKLAVRSRGESVTFVTETVPRFSPGEVCEDRRIVTGRVAAVLDPPGVGDLEWRALVGVG